MHRVLVFVIALTTTFLGGVTLVGWSILAEDGGFRLGRLPTGADFLRTLAYNNTLERKQARA